MDVSRAIVPKSDQLNADDLIAAPVTVTIKSVTEGSSEQPVNIHLVEYPGRAYRPSKGMLRVISELWGSDSDVWVGRRLTLFRNPDVKFGPDTVGGIRISHMSHIDGPKKVALTVSRGRRTAFPVQPLTVASPDVSAQEWIDKFDECKTTEELAAAWSEADRAGATRDPRVLAAKDSRKKVLGAVTTDGVVQGG